MADASLDAELELDTRRALREVDALEERLGRATSVRVEADVRQVTSAITAAVANANATVLVDADAREVTGSIDAAVAASDDQLTLFADAGDVTASIDAAIQTADTNVQITADTAQAETALERVDDKAGKAAESSGRLRQALTLAAAAGVGKALFEIAQAASDLAESTSKATVVFGDEFDRIAVFAENAATAVGLSTAEALEATGTFGNLFQALGATTEVAADLSPQVVTLAADLASFNNLGVDETLEKLRSGLVGEVEPLRALGVSFNAAEVEAKAMELGLADANGEVTEGAKLQARFALIMEQTTLAQGDFARTSEGLANQQRILTAEFKDAVAQVGTGLLPSFLDLVGVGRDLIPTFADFASSVLPPLLSVITSLAPAAGSFLTVLTSLAPVIEAVATVIDGIPDPLLVMIGLAIAAGKATDSLGTSFGKLQGKVTDLLNGTTSLNPWAIGIGVAVGVIGAVMAKSAAEAAAFRAEVAEVTEALRDQDGVLRVTNDSLAGYVETQSRFESRSQLDDLDRLNVSFADVADLSRQGAAGLQEFTEATLRAGETTLAYNNTQFDLAEAQERFNNGAEFSAEQLSTLADGYVIAANGTRLFLSGNEDLVTSFGELQDATAEAAEQELIRLSGLDDSTAAIVDNARANNLLEDGNVDVVAALDETNAALDEQREAEEAAAAAAEELAERQAALSATSSEAALAAQRIAVAIDGVSAAANLGFPPTIQSVQALAAALADGAATETEMQAAADALGVSVENLQGFVDSVSGSLDAFSQTARDSFGGVSEAIDRADEAAEGFSLVAIRDELQRTIDAANAFPFNVQFLIDQGLTGLAGIAAQRGPEFTAALVTAIQNGEGDVAAEVEGLVGTFGTTLGPGGTLDTFLTGTAGPAIALATGETARLAAEAFGPNFNLLDPATQELLLAEGAITGATPAITGAAESAGADAAAGFGTEFAAAPDEAADALDLAEGVVASNGAVVDAAENIGLLAALAFGGSNGFGNSSIQATLVMTALIGALSRGAGPVYGIASAIGRGIGADLGAGIVDGIEGYVGRISSAAAAAVRAAETAARAEARSNSPSLLFAELGEDMGAGVVLGLDASIAEVAAAASDLVSVAAAAVTSTAPAAVAAIPFDEPASTGATVLIPVEVTVHGSITDAQAKAIGANIGSGIAEKLDRRQIIVNARTQ